MRAALRQFVIQRLWHKALAKIAHEQPYIITLTGTVGKTSAKEALAELLATSGRPVVKTLGNMATEVGVPLSLLGYEEQPSNKELLQAVFGGRPKMHNPKTKPYYVLEFSADHRGDIRFLTHKIPSNAGVITAITPAHLQAYPKFEDLIAEKFSLFEGVKKEGYVVLNADDKNIREYHYAGHPVVWFGITERTTTKPGVWAHDLVLTEKGIKCDITMGGGKGIDGVGKASQTITVQTTLLGRHQLYPVLAAVTVAWKEGITPANIKHVLEDYRLPNGRGVLIAGKKQISIIDDTYNSSPDAVKAGLAMVRPFAKDRRSVAILGNMNELGEQSEAAHEDIAEAAAKTVDCLVAVGPFANRMVEVARRHGLSARDSFAFATPEQLLQQLEQVVGSNNVVYVKASQNGMRLERVVKALMLKPDQAEKLLVRQSNYWQK